MISIIFIALFATACNNPHADHHMEGMTNMESTGGEMSQPKIYKDSQGHVVKEFTIVAKETMWQVAPGLHVNALTYDGTIPGKTIQVTQGDRVRVKLVNQLKVPVSIHWHGYPVPNAMDGVPGVTQDAVAPGKSFTYDFIATVPGTYWYHSHYQSSKQVDQGLYGAFIVLPKKEAVKYDREYTLILDEWMGEGGEHGGMMDHSNMHMQMNDQSNMNHSGMEMDHSMSGMNDENKSSMPQMDHDQMMKMMYNVYSVNGKSGSLVKPLEVKKGERVRLRFINAGYMTHLIHLQGQSFQVIATDGHLIDHPPVVKDEAVSIGAGERYDISFIAGSQDFAIDFHDQTPGAKTLVIPVHVIDVKKAPVKADQSNVPVLDLTKYGKATTDGKKGFTASYTLHLNEMMVNGEEIYTINGKSWPKTDPIFVKKGDRIKITLINDGDSDHPMHLHGHTFQVLSHNGVPLTTSIEKDTLVVHPGETYEIAVTADNPGIWMFHCHDLHHAAAGMMTEVEYKDYHGNYSPDMNKVSE
jgi:FtsP/CotA-like multicopper oxidase with cupredoxin domain